MVEDPKEALLRTVEDPKEALLRTAYGALVIGYWLALAVGVALGDLVTFGGVTRQTQRWAQARDAQAHEEERRLHEEDEATLQ